VISPLSFQPAYDCQGCDHSLPDISREVSSEWVPYHFSGYPEDKPTPISHKDANTRLSGVRAGSRMEVQHVAKIIGLDSHHDATESLKCVINVEQLGFDPSRKHSFQELLVFTDNMVSFHVLHKAR